MKHAWPGLSVSVALLFLCTVPAGADPPGDGEGPPRLTVRGEARLEVPADRLRLTLSVITDAAEAGTALERNSAQMRRVVAALGTLGLSSEEQETGRFRIEPQWSPRPRQAPADWRPRITGYTVTNTLRIKTRKIDLAGTIIAEASKAGANRVEEILFDLADPRTSREEAIRQATAHAVADAKTLARAAGVRLRGVLSLSLDQASAAPVRMRAAGLAQGQTLAAGASLPPISPGDVAVEARVLVIYRIGEGK